MQLALSSLTTERKWRAATGLTKRRFERLRQWFKEAYGQLFDLQITEREQLTIHESIMKTEEELLFFTLYTWRLCGIMELLLIILILKSQQVN